MSMVVTDFKQGSQEWLDNRLRAFNASEAPVMMGAHPNMTRDELIEAKATCNPKEYSDFIQRVVFAKGHETEDLARTLLQEIIGEELFPVSGKNGLYQASFDGLTVMQDVGFEHKQWNAELAAMVGNNNPPPYIFWQLEHQLLVCPDMEKVILVVSDGTSDNWVQMEYTAVPGRREALIAGWDQWAEDCASFVPAIKKGELVGVRPDSLPALRVEVDGQLITKSNLAEFRAGAEQLIGSIKTELVTDQDFSDAEAAIKWLAEGEKKIDSAIEQAMSRTGPLEELVRTLKDVQQNLMRTTRLTLNKQVEAQKVNRRNDIVADAKSAFAAFMSIVHDDLKRIQITSVAPDFYLAIKGKRNFESMISACNDLLAESKIKVNEIAAGVRGNLALLKQHESHSFLFTDYQALAFMDRDHLQLTISNRIDEHRKQQEQQEAARVQGHKNSIAGIEAAGEFNDETPYSALRLTRDRVEKIDTGKMEEFSIKADQAKASTLQRIDERMRVLTELESKKAEDARIAREKEAAAALEAKRVEEAAALEAKKAEDAKEEFRRSVSNDPARSLGAGVPLAPAKVRSEEPAEYVADQAEAEGEFWPNDQEMVDVLAQHFQVSKGRVVMWLGHFNANTVDAE